MNTNTIIKNEAKQILSGNWGIAIASYLLVWFLYLIYSTISSFAYIISNVSLLESLKDPFDNIFTVVVGLIFSLVAVVVVLLLMPVFSGITLNYVNLTLNKPIFFPNVISYFNKKDYINSLKFWISYIMRYVICVVFGLLSLNAFYNLAISAENALFTNLLFALLVIIAIALVVVFIIISCSYFLAPYIHVSNKTLSATRCIDLSIKIMKQNRKKYYSLLLSLLPWILLSFLVIPTLYTVPYIFTSFSVSAKYIISNNLKEF